MPVEERFGANGRSPRDEWEYSSTFGDSDGVGEGYATSFPYAATGHGERMYRILLFDEGTGSGAGPLRAWP